MTEGARRGLVLTLRWLRRPIGESDGAAAVAVLAIGLAHGQEKRDRRTRADPPRAIRRGLVGADVVDAAVFRDDGGELRSELGGLSLAGAIQGFAWVALALFGPFDRLVKVLVQLIDGIDACWGLFAVWIFHGLRSIFAVRLLDDVLQRKR